ncbi:interleukin-10 [Gracilinanus agilis]|uniref:interleukin-10 n=1 Tax=Gracilinanus agilis TaxID=191870 RepID=UPI001CFE5E4B|nr:interleukin-10 [Gracilinanus agilis]
MPTSMLLFCLLFLTDLNSGSTTEDNCSGFSIRLPDMLRDLRTDFSKVKIYFQKKDTLETRLIDRSLLEDLKSYLGCQAMSEMIKFYLEKVMPQAENEKGVEKNVGFLRDKLKRLRLQVKRCHRFLPCEEESKAVSRVKSTYEKVSPAEWVVSEVKGA